MRTADFEYTLPDGLIAQMARPRGAVSAQTLLSSLTDAAALQGPRASRPRPRRGTGERYLL